MIKQSKEFYKQVYFAQPGQHPAGTWNDVVMSFKRDMLKLPNLISSIRILIAPLLFAFAFLQMETWFLGALVFSGFTDVLDGFIARKFGMITPLGGLALLAGWAALALAAIRPGARAGHI